MELEHSSEAAAVADHLFKELRTFILPDELDLKIQVLEAYILLATRSKSKIDQAMQIFIDILEKEKDYLPALLGMSTTFMLEKSTTKARNALKRVAKMPYSHELADDFERGYLLLADIYIQKSKFDLSEDLCNRCLKSTNFDGKVRDLSTFYRKYPSYPRFSDSEISQRNVLRFSENGFRKVRKKLERRLEV